MQERTIPYFSLIAPPHVKVHLSVVYEHNIVHEWSIQNASHDVQEDQFLPWKYTVRKMVAIKLSYLWSFSGPKSKGILLGVATENRWMVLIARHRIGANGTIWLPASAAKEVGQ